MSAGDFRSGILPEVDPKRNGAASAPLHSLPFYEYNNSISKTRDDGAEDESHNEPFESRFRNYFLGGWK